MLASLTCLFGQILEVNAVLILVSFILCHSKLSSLKGLCLDS